MRQLFFLLSFNLIFSSSFAQSSVEETSVETMKAFKSIVGEYVNRRGDVGSVTLHFFEKNPDQPDLFGPKEFRLSISIGPKDDFAEIEMNERDFLEVEKNGNVIFRSTQDDCDNPGCTNYDVVVEFKKKSNGSYFIKAVAEYVTDTEDISYDLGDNFSDLSSEEKDEVLDKKCKDYYGSSARVEDYYEDYSDNVSVHCFYTTETFLRKK